MNLLDFELMLWFVKTVFWTFWELWKNSKIFHDWPWMKMDIHAKDQKRRRERVEKVKKLRTRQEVMKPTRNRSEMTHSVHGRTITEDKRDESKLLSDF